MKLASVGPLPTLITSLVFGAACTVLAVFVTFSEISEVKLKVYSVVFWLLLVLQQYVIYALLIRHTASDSVSARQHPCIYSVCVCAYSLHCFYSDRLVPLFSLCSLHTS